MPDDKSSTEELIWLYSRTQASLLVPVDCAQTFINASRFHTQALHCPCFPWEACGCACHGGELRKYDKPEETPVL